MGVEPWPPLAGLGPDALRVDEALATASVPEVEALLATLPDVPALAAARFALLQRRGDSPDEADAAARVAIAALEAAGNARSALLVAVEHASVLAASKSRLADARAIASALPTPADDAALSAAVLRVRGAIARADGDLGGSLLALEAARARARDAADPREIVRAENTLGSSYAALGVDALARDALESARELAELTRQRQSAGVAAGQLAVLALDADDPKTAARHLETQRAIAVRLGDVHGLARSLSLLVEAYAACHEPGRARDAAHAARDLYARSPTAWTRLQAVLATIYEAEAALAAGDRPRADELLASTAIERASSEPALRVARARETFVRLWTLASERASDPRAAIEAALSPLRTSPRPTWVLRALVLALRAAETSGWTAGAPLLALRAAAVLEARGAASSRALVTLRALAPDAAVRRAMALGRDLVLRGRLALGPFGPFDAHVLSLELDGEDGAFDAVLASLGEPPDDLLVGFEGPLRAHIVSNDADALERAETFARGAAAVRACTRRPCRAEITHVPSAGLDLVIHRP